MSDTCHICHQPIVDGDARYTGQEPELSSHYACHQTRRDGFLSAFEQFEQSSARLRRSLAELGTALRTVRPILDEEERTSGLYTDIIKE